LIRKYNPPSIRGTSDKVDSVGYNLVWRRVWRRGQAGIENFDFKFAGFSEDLVPSTYTTIGRNILIDEFLINAWVK